MTELIIGQSRVQHLVHATVGAASLMRRQDGCKAERAQAGAADTGEAIAAPNRRAFQTVVLHS
jgi:hypothetical protein